MKSNKLNIHPDIHWREMIVSKLYSKEYMIKRWKEIGYKPEYIQLKLEL